MQHTIENEFLTVTVESKGAELVSMVDKATGAEMMWDGQKDVWPRRAPILFPYCGKLNGGRYTLDGATYQGGQHGFGRDLEHRTEHDLRALSESRARGKWARPNLLHTD